MAASDLFELIFGRLSRAEAGAEIFGEDEARQWPYGALASLVKAGMFQPAQPAQVIECDGCEHNCFMPVHIRPSEGNRVAYAFISCDKPEDMGRIRVELTRLRQWQMTGGTLAGTVARLLGFKRPPQADITGKRWVLGLLKGKETKGAVTLSIDDGVMVALAGHSVSVSLAELLTFDKRGLTTDRVNLFRLLDGDTRQPAAGMGSPAWRKKNATAAANARHSKVGGSRDIQKLIRVVWASGKYTSRDRCAEEECAALGISISTARKALRNTPEPKRV